MEFTTGPRERERHSKNAYFGSRHRSRFKSLRCNNWNAKNEMARIISKSASTNKTLLLDVYCSKTISDIEFILLYVNSCSNLQLPYWKYDGFSLEDMNDDECKAEFRFLRDKHIT